MDLDKLKIFYATAQAGSFTKAAARLNLSQSSISRHIGHLEDNLKTALFYRHPRGLYLTKEGEVLLSSAKTIFKEIEFAKNLIAERSEEPKGTIKVAMCAGWAATLLVPYVGEFTAKYPKISLNIFGSDTNPDLALNEADVAIYPSMPDQSNLIQEYLMSFHLRLYASQEYLDKFGTPKTPADLDHHRLIAYGDHSHAFSNLSWHLSLGTSLGRFRKPYMQINSSILHYRLAEAGIGIVTLAKERSVPKVSSLVEVLPDYPGPTLEVYYIYPEHLKNSKRVQVLQSFLKEIIAHNQWE